MGNESAVTSFILTAYFQLEDHRYLFFVCFLLLYILIVVANSVLIIAIFIERVLHEPMYLFICNLAVNGVFGGSSLLPSMLHILLSQKYEISLTSCLLQIYFLHSYSAVEFTILAVMSYDRYVAICCPLHYQFLMSPNKLYAAMTLSWVIPLMYFALYFILTVQSTFCHKIIERVYCSNFALVQLSCFDTNVHSLVGLALLFISPFSQIAMILFSYGQILRICLLGSKESRMKATKTCTPHLLTVFNYSVGCLFEVIQSRLNMSHVSHKIRIFMSLYFLIIPPLFNPVLYGITIQSIRVQIFKLLFRKLNDAY